MSQVQKERATGKQENPELPGEVPGSDARASAKTVSEETQDLLDEIDELLSELPQDLAVTFVQKGGE